MLKLRQLHLTTALRPSLYDDESLLFVQDGVGLYEGKFKIEHYQSGHAYLTSHRVCYVDNADPRKFSVAVDLKDIERTEYYAGFFKSSPKITLLPRPSTRLSQSIRSPAPKYSTASDALLQPLPPGFQSMSQAPAPARDSNSTWICPICGFSNPVPSNFDPSTANQHTPLPPCQACGISPPLAHLIKASIAGMSNRATGAVPSPQRDPTAADGLATTSTRGSNQCPRCTFQNHSSLTICEICGAPLQPSLIPRSMLEGSRPESPGPSNAIIGDETIETIKLSFRAGGDKVFLDKVRSALVQRQWILQSAPPIPRPGPSPSHGSSHLFPPPAGTPPRSPMPQQSIIGIAGLEQRGLTLRKTNEEVMGSAFNDLEALKTSAKEVIAMAEQFAKQGHGNNSTEAQRLLSDSVSALGLVTTTKDMFGPGSSSDTLYITELSRNLAEFLTDDRRGVLRHEGGIMSLVDLWAVFNRRTRNGIELVSPLDFEKAATAWDTLHLPIRLRRFKSGLRVVQERSRTDEKTIASLLVWLREPQSKSSSLASDDNPMVPAFGRGVTAQETAERFGWSVGVAAEELEMAEETGALCRDQCLDGTRFWENHFMRAWDSITSLPRQVDAVVGTMNDVRV